MHRMCFINLVKERDLFVVDSVNFFANSFNLLLVRLRLEREDVFGALDVCLCLFLCFFSQINCSFGAFKIFRQ